MRVGCLGCLGSILGAIAIAGLVGGGFWAWGRVWETPPLPDGHTQASPASLDRKLADLEPRGSGRPAPGAIVLSEAEVSAVASRQLGDAGLLISPPLIEMQPGRAMVQWRGPVDGLLQGPPFGWLGPLLPSSLKEWPVWITLSGGVRLQPAAAPRRPRYAEASVTSVRLGRLPIPAWLLILMTGPRGASLLRWPVPPTVDHIELGDGRLTIRTR